MKYSTVYNIQLDSLSKNYNMFKIKSVIFHEPATIVYWKDGTKTVVKCGDGDTYSKETGLAMAISKKALGNSGNFNEVFKKYLTEEKQDEYDTEDIIALLREIFYDKKN